MGFWQKVLGYAGSPWSQGGVKPGDSVFLTSKVLKTACWANGYN